MKERPILFSGEMVRAILDGRKTQTRRVIKPQPGNDICGIYAEETADFSGQTGRWILNAKTLTGKYWAKGFIKCPYGQPGDRLWVRETFAYAPGSLPEENRIWYKSDDELRRDELAVWRPSIHMPRRASRINIEITNTGVERVQDITVENAISEGVDVYVGWHAEHAMKKFITLWNSINLDRGYGWDSDPWVWVIEFRKI